ncbi:hydrogenase 4 subunit D [archaeon]|nr:MAG: hydrogenase 4 subunit D [archaeon]RLG64897.1 MAG: hydrogenase 4 subunit D [archaeon]
MATTEILSLLTIIVPGIGWATVSLLYRKGIKLGLLANIFSFLTLIICAFNVLTYFTASTPMIYTLVEFNGIEVISFIVDSISVAISFLVVFIGCIILLFSLGYMTPENREHPITEGYAWFYGSMLLFMASMVGVVYSYSLITMAIFYEVTGLCSFVLIGFFHENPKSRYSAMKALYITHLGWIFLIVATALLYSFSGSVTFNALSNLTPYVKSATVLLLAIAAWAKSAQIPFYTWLPDAMIAPTPVSAYLHAAAMVKVGVFLLFRSIQYAAPIDQFVGLIIGVMAVLTMVYGLVMYVPQLDMKRLLAYSTITQLSYMFLALSFASIGAVEGLRGSIFHLWNHAYAKALFFLTAGALSYATGSKFLIDYRGLIERSRILAISFSVAAFSISGIPPLACFYSKFVIFLSGFSHSPIWVPALTLIAIGESVCCFIIFLYWVIKCIYGEASDHISKMQDIPLTMSVALVVLVIMCFISAYIMYPLLEQITFAGR